MKTKKPRNRWHATQVVVMVRHSRALSDAEAHEWVRGALANHPSTPGADIDWATAVPPIADE
jgi:hypothetical protein